MNAPSQARAAEWYFDFISPYSYLQSERLDRLEGLALRPRPVLFAALLDHWGQLGPAELPPKRNFIYRQLQWIADRDGIAFRFPKRHPFNPLRALGLAIALDGDWRAIHAIFRAIWQEGVEADTDEGFAELCHRLDVRDGEARIAKPRVKAELRRNGETAIAAGVFGVPTLVIDGRIFWGYDATDMVADYLRNPGYFDSEEMRRIDALPVGVARAAPPVRARSPG